MQDPIQVHLSSAIKGSSVLHYRREKNQVTFLFKDGVHGFVQTGFTVHATHRLYPISSHQSCTLPIKYLHSFSGTSIGAIQMEYV